MLCVYIYVCVYLFNRRIKKNIDYSLGERVNNMKETKIEARLLWSYSDLQIWICISVNILYNYKQNEIKNDPKKQKQNKTNV